MADLLRHWRLSLLLNAVAFVLGIAVNSLVGPNAASIDIRIQAPLIALIGVVIAATAGVVGASYGAAIGARAAREVAESAAREAQADRQQADRHRFTAERHRLYGILITAADAYYRGVSGRKRVLDAAAKGVKYPTEALPDLDDIMRTVELIRLVAPAEVVRTARRLRVAAAVLSPYSVIPPGHAAYPNEWDVCKAGYEHAQREFIDAVRDDLGAESLHRNAPPTASDTPAGETDQPDS